MFNGFRPKKGKKVFKKRKFKKSFRKKTVNSYSQKNSRGGRSF